MGKKGKKAHGTVHHIRPVSREGEKNPENEIYIEPDTLHEAWHILWGNLLVEEVICLIQNVWSDDQGRIKEEYLAGEKIVKKRKTVDKRKLAWEIIFDGARSSKQAVKIIEEKFTKRT